MPSKSELVRQALKQNPNPDPQEIVEIAEKVGCSKALVYKQLRKMPKPEIAPTPTPAEAVVVVEEGEEIEVPAEEKVPAREIVEVPAERPKPSVAEALEEIKVMKDMLRGLYILGLSDQGVLGSKYGRPEDQCVRVSDQTYRWLSRRATPEQLESYDTILLALSHLALIAPIVKDVIEERRKKPKKVKEVVRQD